jgi:threonyl-tRNA synthetase
MRLFRSFRPASNQFHQNARHKFVRSHTVDHRDLANRQKLLTNSPYSPGSPLFLPAGADMLNKLTACLRAHYPAFGFREVITPTIYKKTLWERSGHWDNYAEDMFSVSGRGLSKEGIEEGKEEEEFGLKPMNCPGHCLLFASEPRSHRQLPIRYADFSALHRNENSGSLTGLTRVRRLHQDDGHIFCAPGQVEAEILRTLEFVELVYKHIFDLPGYRLVLSTRPEESYIGTVAEWDMAEAQLKSALATAGVQWDLSPGDAAFYGPKIDFYLTDVNGKDHQTATVQLDFQLPQRFELEYQVGDESAGAETPVLIHRAVLGSLERFLALLIEHYNGTYPFWLSPRPVVLLTVSTTPEEIAYTEKVAGVLSGSTPAGDTLDDSAKHTLIKRPSARPPLQIDTDVAARPLGKKLELARASGYNFIGVVGPRDVREQTVTLEMANQKQGAELLHGDEQNKGRRKLDIRKARRIFEELQDRYW